MSKVGAAVANSVALIYFQQDMDVMVTLCRVVYEIIFHLLKCTGLWHQPNDEEWHILIYCILAVYLNILLVTALIWNKKL